MPLSIEVVFNDFGKIAERMVPVGDAWAELAATRAQAEAITNTTRVDTGAMKDGWRIARLSEGVWIVYNTQFYAIFHEFGTFRMAAAPMLVPAVETLRASLPDYWAMVLR